MSARKSLRERLEQARLQNFLDMRVTTPAFEGLHVRCRAMTPEELNEAIERQKGKADAGIAMGLDVLVSTCVGIWEEVDGKGVSPVDGFPGVIDLNTLELSGPLPTFSSPELADELGLEEHSAEANVLALLAPHSRLRVMVYSDALQDFSTGANENVVRTARGN